MNIAIEGLDILSDADLENTWSRALQIIITTHKHFFHNFSTFFWGGGRGGGGNKLCLSPQRKP